MLQITPSFFIGREETVFRPTCPWQRIIRLPICSGANMAQYQPTVGL